MRQNRANQGPNPAFESPTGDRRIPFMADTNAIKWLRSQGVAIVVLEYDYERIGAEAAAAAVDRPLETVCKTLIVRGQDKSTWTAVVPGDQRFDTRKMAGVMGCKNADLADTKEAERISGYKVGGVSPFCMKRTLPTVVEETLLVLDRIVVNAGRRGVLVELATEDVVRLSDARVADVCV